MNESGLFTILNYNMLSIDTTRPISISLGQGRDYAYHFQPHEEVPALLQQSKLNPGRCIIVTDEQVGKHYANRLRTIMLNAGWAPLTITLPAGEETKGYKHLHQIYDEALGWGIDRKTPVLALGGGVVGDLAGFAAASMLRGLPLVQLPTTLIAQVDSALGGKTGINHKTGKNLIGAFHQPLFVCSDLTTLNTLSQRDWASGLAEVVKHGLIADSQFFERLASNMEAILARDADVMAPVIYRAAQIKAEVVSEDEHEAGLRAILNFGHTFGHAIEHVAGYGHYSHGEAVAIGMRAALHLSHTLHPSLDYNRADALVAQLPVMGAKTSLPIQDLMHAMQHDKKVLSGRIRFVLLDQIGHAYVEEGARLSDAQAAFEHALA